MVNAKLAPDPVEKPGTLNGSVKGMLPPSTIIVESQSLYAGNIKEINIITDCIQQQIIITFKKCRTSLKKNDAAAAI